MWSTGTCLKILGLLTVIIICLIIASVLIVHFHSSNMASVLEKAQTGKKAGDKFLNEVLKKLE